MRSSLFLSLSLCFGTACAAVPGKTPAGSPSSPTSSSTSSSGATPAPESAPAAAAADAPFVGSSSTLQPGENASPAEQSCDGAHDHCLPAGTVFAYDPESLDEAYVGWPTDEGPWLYIRKDVMRGGAQTWTSERATPSTLSAGATVVYFGHGEDPPISEANAIAGMWQIGTVASIDAGAGTFTTDKGKTIRIDTARLVR